jgi:hypothetical protein
MAASAISQYIEVPSVDHLEGLHKVDLRAIAEHYGLFVSEKALKAELLVLVKEGLMRKHIFLLKDDKREASGEETVSLLGT